MNTIYADGKVSFSSNTAHVTVINITVINMINLVTIYKAFLTKGPNYRKHRSSTRNLYRKRSPTIFFN